MTLLNTPSRGWVFALFHQVSVTLPEELEVEPEPDPLALVLLEPPPLLQAASTRLVAAAATTAAAARLLIIRMLISPGGKRPSAGLVKGRPSPGPAKILPKVSDVTFDGAVIVRSGNPEVNPWFPARYRHFR
jgi:hypothetical protein